MSDRPKHLKLVLVLLLSISALTVLVAAPPTFPQGNENGFSVEPGSFTASDVKALGTPYIIPQNIIVWNYDTNDRIVTLATEKPPGENVTPGYQPIPNKDWVIPLFENNLSSSFTIPENSYAIVQTSFNIPRVENYLNQKWEVWITATRQPISENEPVIVSLAVRVKINTATTFSGAGNASIDLKVAIIVIAVVAIVAGLSGWFYHTKKGGRKPEMARSPKK